MEQVMSAAAVAKVLSCTTQRVYQLARQGKLPAMILSEGKYRRRWLFSASEVERYAAEREERKAA